MRLVGFVPDDKLRDLLHRAGCVVIPSLYEPFGIVALEALAGGAPLIAARTGGLAELIEDTGAGLLFDPGNADELAGCIEQVLATAPSPTACADAGGVARRPLLVGGDRQRAGRGVPRRHHRRDRGGPHPRLTPGMISTSNSCGTTIPRPRIRRPARRRRRSGARPKVTSLPAYATGTSIRGSPRHPRGLVGAARARHQPALGVGPGAGRAVRADLAGVERRAGAPGAHGAHHVVGAARRPSPPTRRSCATSPAPRAGSTPRSPVRRGSAPRDRLAAAARWRTSPPSSASPRRCRSTPAASACSPATT